MVKSSKIYIAGHDLVSLVKDMMQSDVTLMQKDQYLKKGGYSANNYYE
jgi:GDPmannose 4,6-dehydratase